MKNILHEIKEATENFLGRNNLTSPMMVKDATVNGTPGQSQVQLTAKPAGNDLYELRIQRLDLTKKPSLTNLTAKSANDGRYDMSPTLRTRAQVLDTITSFVNRYEELGFVQENAKTPSPKKNRSAQVLKT